MRKLVTDAEGKKSEYTQTNFKHLKQKYMQHTGVRRESRDQKPESFTDISRAGIYTEKKISKISVGISKNHILEMDISIFCVCLVA